jgi:hypothetical protein
VLVFGVPNLVVFQFTRVAGLLAGAGVLLVLDTALASGSGRRAGRWAAGAALVVLASLLRFEPAALVLALTVPLGLASFFVQGERPRRLRPWVVAGAVLAGALVVSLALRALDERWYATSPGWSEYLAHNRIRAELTELRGGDPGARDAILRGAGWSQNDLAMLDNWFYASPAVFGLERMRGARAALRQRPPASPGAVARTLLRAAGEAVARGLPAIAFAAGLIVLVQGWPARGFVGYAVLAAVGTLVLVTLLFKPPPPRVVWTVWALQAAVAVRVAAPARAAGRLRIAAGTVLLLAAVAASLGPVRAQARDRHAGTAQLADDLVRWAPTVAGLHVSVGGAFPEELVMWPFQARPALPGLAVLPIGAAAYTPLVQGFLQREGIPDLPLALCTRPTMRLLVSSTLLDPIARYLAEHHQLTVALVPDYQGRGINTYRCQPVAGGGPLSGRGPSGPSTGRPRSYT